MLRLPIVGYSTMEKFHTTGLSVSSNLNAVSRTDRTISAKASVKFKKVYQWEFDALISSSANLSPLCTRKESQPPHHVQPSGEKTDVHDLPPAEKVILQKTSNQAQSSQKQEQQWTSHRFE